jgi:uncharacterized protein (DUF305 family)
MRIRSFATTCLLVISILGPTWAALPVRAEDSSASRAYVQSMQKMHEDMQTMKPTGDPSMDFVMMMKPHHQAAVEMAETYLKYGKDPTLTKMAEDIVRSQKEEIQQMTDWEAKHGM